MKKFRANESNDVKPYMLNSNDIEQENSDISDEEKTYKKFEEKEEKDPYITPKMKKFRTILGILTIVVFVPSLLQGTPNKSYIDDISTGIIENVNVGDVLSKDAIKLDAKDQSVEVTNGYGNIEVSIWNFAEVEDNDYVQVFIDGVAEGAPFLIRHKPVKISVPDKAVIQVQGVRDGSNNGITYAVFFNKTGETYLNTVPLNGMNTYTIISK
ncbi:hypothetical protein SDC9_108133 [bioreactor metagenome]|uniref:Uncharacterized protein n=1 Tax=bioreactor metagenome TaxID=1076179 RepID=A0A645B772_9ZZZZ